MLKDEKLVASGKLSRGTVVELSSTLNIAKTKELMRLLNDRQWTVELPSLLEKLVGSPVRLQFDLKAMPPKILVIARKEAFN